jgi:UDP-2,3-diacylglucosamine hydrolase
VSAAAAWGAVDFISDLHLSEKTPHGFEAWSEYMRTSCADAIFILGDLFDVWVGDDSRHGDFETRCGRVLAQAASKRNVFFMVGNRDFLVGEVFLAECNVQPLHDPTVLAAFGQRMLLTHGDSLCLSDIRYQKFRSVVRTPHWQAAVLKQSLSARRELARKVREESERFHAVESTEPAHDLDLPTCLDWMNLAQTFTLVHGHTHLPADQILSPQCIRHVLSDWSLDEGCIPVRAEVLRWSRGGVNRIPLAQASRASFI